LFHGFTLYFDLDIPDSFTGNIKKQELCLSVQYPIEGDDFEKAKKLKVYATDYL